MVHFKDTVDMSQVKFVVWDGLLTGVEALAVFGYGLVVTSLCDGTHMSNSLHYRGYAADLRTRHMKVGDLPGVVRELQARLGKEWQVVLEKDHIHMEYDPHGDGGVGLP